MFMSRLVRHAIGLMALGFTTPTAALVGAKLASDWPPHRNVGSPPRHTAFGRSRNGRRRRFGGGGLAVEFGRITVRPDRPKLSGAKGLRP